MPNLTKRVVDGAKPAAKPVYLWDDQVKGFGLLVLPSGTKSFVLQYRNGSGRSRRFTIGRYGTFTPDEARKAAREALHLVSKGGDPMADKSALRSAPDVSAVLDRYLDDYVKQRNAKSTQAEAERVIEKHIRPRLGKLKVAAVTPSDVARLHQAMARTPRQANHVLSIISKAFNLAEVWGLRSRNSNPVHGIERYPENHRERFLSAPELQRLGATLIEAETDGLPWVIKANGSKHLPKDANQQRTSVNPGALAVIKLLLFTGARLSEILTLRWEHVDMQADMLALPDRKGGGRRPHPVSTYALEILERLSPVDGSPWVFPRDRDVSRHLTKEVLENAWQRIRHHAGIPDVRLHDLRHTVGTYAGQAGGNAFIVRDLLRHKNTAMTNRYVNRDDDPVRAMANDVSNRIASELASGGRDTQHLRSTG
ncbi:integrase, partial [Zhengella mangrovi]